MDFPTLEQIISLELSNEEFSVTSDPISLELDFEDRYPNQLPLTLSENDDIIACKICSFPICALDDLSTVLPALSDGSLAYVFPVNKFGKYYIFKIKFSF